MGDMPEMPGISEDPPSIWNLLQCNKSRLNQEDLDADVSSAMVRLNAMLGEEPLSRDDEDAGVDRSSSPYANGAGCGAQEENIQDEKLARCRAREEEEEKQAQEQLQMRSTG